MNNIKKLAQTLSPALFAAPHRGISPSKPYLPTLLMSVGLITTASSVQATSWQYLGGSSGYNHTSGKPNSLSDKSSVMPSDLLTTVLNRLPESQPIGSNPAALALLTNDTGANLFLKAAANVKVSYVSEGAGYQNSVGFFKFNKAELTTLTIDKCKMLDSILFPNFSDTVLQFGKAVDLGNYVAGDAIGFTIVGNGWQSSAGVVDPNKAASKIFRTIKRFNPEPDNSNNLRAHTLLFAYPEKELMVLAFEDLNRESGSNNDYGYTSDNDFNDVILAIHVTPWSAVDCANCNLLVTPPPAGCSRKPYRHDDDHDGLDDEHDGRDDDHDGHDDDHHDGHDDDHDGHDDDYDGRDGDHDGFDDDHHDARDDDHDGHDDDHDGRDDDHDGSDDDHHDKDASCKLPETPEPSNCKVPLTTRPIPAGALTNNGRKVNICHFPPGNAANVQQINISLRALDTHLTHHDDAFQINGVCPPLTCPPPPPTCTLPQVLQDGACVTPAPTCASPQVLQNGVCVTPPPSTCTLPQVLQDGACVTPAPTCTSPQVLQNGACVTPPPLSGENGPISWREITMPPAVVDTNKEAKAAVKITKDAAKVQCMAEEKINNTGRNCNNL